MSLLRALLLLIAATLIAAATPVSGPVPEPGTAVWFGVHFQDSHGGGPDSAEAVRARTAADIIAADLTARGFTLIPPPAGTALPRNPARSNGADGRIAAQSGARYAISAEVIKVSNLILSVSLRVRDAATGEPVRSGAVDIRGNTDESWQRGFSYLLRNVIFRP